MTPGSVFRQAPLLLHISVAPTHPPKADQSSAMVKGRGRVPAVVAHERSVVHKGGVYDLPRVERAQTDRTPT